MQQLTMQHIVGRLPGVDIAHAPLEWPPHGVEHRLDIPADEDHCYTGQQPAQEALVRAREATGWTVVAQPSHGAVDGHQEVSCCCHVPACAASDCRQSPVQASTLKSSLVSSRCRPAALISASSACCTVPAGDLGAGKLALNSSNAIKGGQPLRNTHLMQGEGEPTDGLSHQQQWPLCSTSLPTHQQQWADCCGGLPLLSTAVTRLQQGHAPHICSMACMQPSYLRSRCAHTRLRPHVSAPLSCVHAACQ